MCLERERDGGARDADVARGEGQDAGEIERRNDEERREERLVDPERGCDRRWLQQGASAIASPTQPVICAAARGQRPRTRKTSRTWAYLLPGRVERARQATIAATRTPSSRSAIGQRGSAPLSEPSVSTSASHSARTAPMEVAIPPTVQSRPSFGSVREKRAKRTAVPILAGANAFTTEPVQYRAAASGRDVEPPHRVSADLQAAADVSSEPAKAAPAIQIHTAEASESPSIPAPTRSPSSCGVAASTTSAPIDPRNRAR